MPQRAPAHTLSCLVVALSIGIVPVVEGESETRLRQLPAAPASSWMPTHPELWLDEVRAQRRAWEARRDAVREDYKARRRLNHPRSAARQEAWEEDVRRRRALHQERIDRNWELLGNLGPGQPPPTVPNSLPPGETASGIGAEPILFTPPGWDNLWYFSGF